MRDLFRGYYRPKDKEFKKLWEECIFTLDANVLLHVYRFTPDTRQRFLSVLRRLRDRIWLPHQAAHEFHKNRLEVITHQDEVYKELTKLLDKHLSEITSYLRQR